MLSQTILRVLRRRSGRSTKVVFTVANFHQLLSAVLFCVFSRLATVLQEHQDAEKYNSLHFHLRRRFMRKFVRPLGLAALCAGLLFACFADIHGQDKGPPDNPPKAGKGAKGKGFGGGGTKSPDVHPDGSV